MRQIVFGLGLGIGLGIAGILLAFPGHTRATNAYDQSLQSVQAAIGLYHDTINTLFNERMALLMSGDGDNTVYYTTDDAGNNRPDAAQCTQQNVTTFCLANDALKEFSVFEQAMMTRSKRFWNEEDTLEDTSITATLLTQQLRASAIAEEMKVAEVALDRALATYNELHVAYPLHQQYQQIIIDLTKYRDALASVRDEVEVYPSKLIDASTPSCG